MDKFNKCLSTDPKQVLNCTLKGRGSPATHKTIWREDIHNEMQERDLKDELQNNYERLL